MTILTDGNPDNPIIGWQNFVTTANVIADSEDSSYPASNLANGSTYLRWKSLIATLQYVTVSLNGTELVDYVGVAGHNFGSTSTPVNVQGSTGSTLGSNVASTGVASTIGDYTSLSANAFDGTTSQAIAASAQKTSATFFYIGRQFTTPQPVFKAIVYGSNDQGYVNGANPNVTLNLYGSDVAPASSENGTLLGTLTFADTANESGNPRTITSTDQITGWRYIWVEAVQAGGAATMAIAELQIFAATITWTDLTAAITPADDKPLLLPFLRGLYTGVRLQLAAGTGNPQAAVVYVGQRLTLQRRVYVGHTPAPYGRITNVVNGVSESGMFLGRILIGHTVQTTLAIQNISPDFYRNWIDPFLVAAEKTPFFLSWRPTKYPFEVGYCWLTGDPQPSNQRANGMMSVTLAMNGISGVALT